VILVAEALHEQRVARIAQEIAARQDGTPGAREPVRLVLIAGPSASGKTTFSRRLSIQLLANGLRPFALELDNYFVDRLKTPRDENGQYDFESLAALDLSLFNAASPAPARRPGGHHALLQLSRPASARRGAPFSCGPTTSSSSRASTA
jgi:uridine kinase